MIPKAKQGATLKQSTIYTYQFTCDECGKVLIIEVPNLHGYSRKYCDDCLPLVRRRKNLEAVRKHRANKKTVTSEG